MSRDSSRTAQLEVNDVLEAARTAAQIANERLATAGPPGADFHVECQELVDKCAELFQAEVCGLWLVRDGFAELEAYSGYIYPSGIPLAHHQLQTKLRYRVDPNRNGTAGFDGVTGYIASTGQEFSGDVPDAVRQHPSYAGKPDQLRIWDKTSRPFRCMFGVPLSVAGATIGVLKVENKRVNGRDEVFDPTDKALLRYLGQFFAARIATRPRPSPSTTVSNAQRDTFHMDRVIERLPIHIEIALERRLPSSIGTGFKKAVVVGLGGSALPADVLNDVFQDELHEPVQICRSYNLPSNIDESTLIIVSSFSGSTEEVLSAIDHLDAPVGKVVALTAGGHLKTLAATRGYPLVEIPIDREPRGFQPRSAFGFIVTFLARILHAAGVMRDPTARLGRLPSFLRSINTRAAGEDVAAWLGNRIPVVYTDERHLLSIARVAKIKFNENAKRPAFFNAFPELNHNEMIGFSEPLADFGILYLHDPSSRPKIHRRFEVMKRVFEREQGGHVRCRLWAMPGDSPAERVFAALQFADWCSYALALRHGQDPTPVLLVERFKAMLDMPDDGAAGEAS